MSWYVPVPRPLTAAVWFTFIRSCGVLSRKLNWVARTCRVSLTRPDRVSIRAAWSTSWSLYSWYSRVHSKALTVERTSAC